MDNNTAQSIKIVYVEDEPSIAQLLVSGLGLFGIIVNPIFMSAEELLENMNHPDYVEADLLFFDIRLPRMTGLELAAEVRARGETRPLVLVSAWPAPTTAEVAELDAQFMAKPFDFPDVIKTIQKLVEK